MDLSIIIADSDDLRIKSCISSIDEDVEVLVSLNGASRELEALVKELSVNSCTIADKGLAAALNNGIINARYDKIIIIDSDCTFEKGCIRMLYDALKYSEMVRGIQITKYVGIMGRIISKAREFHGNTNPDIYLDEIRAYKPLAFRKECALNMGGKMYYDQLKLSEDFEMNERRKKAGIPITFLPDAKIYHEPLSVMSDLKSAYKYGADRHTLVRRGLTKDKKSFFQSLKKLRNRCIPRQGMAVAAYMVFWTATYDLGFYTQKYLDINGIENE